MPLRSTSWNKKIWQSIIRNFQIPHVPYKIHKAGNPGRPTVSASPTSNISAYWDSALATLVKRLTTQVKDIMLFRCWNRLLLYDLIVSFSRWIRNLSVLSVIPNNDGLDLGPLQQTPTNTLVWQAELVLNLNSFEFSNGHYHEVGDAAMKNKMRPKYACLFEENLWRLTGKQAWTLQTTTRPWWVPFTTLLWSTSLKSASLSFLLVGPLLSHIWRQNYYDHSLQAQRYPHLLWL